MNAKNNGAAGLDMHVGSVAIHGGFKYALKEFHAFFGCNALAGFMPEICVSRRNTSVG
jgi:hypothetical protein